MWVRFSSALAYVVQMDLFSPAAATGVVLAALFACKSGKEVPDAGAAAVTDNSAALEAKRAGFVSGCMKTAKNTAYCACSFDQFKIVLKDADLRVDPTPEQLASVRQKSASACADKLVEDDIKRDFTSTCTADAGDSKRCECLWNSLRKALDLADFLDDPPQKKRSDADAVAQKACPAAPVLSEAATKKTFMETCTLVCGGLMPCVTDEDLRAPCECAWKKLRPKHSLEKLAHMMLGDALREAPECGP